MLGKLLFIVLIGVVALGLFGALLGGAAEDATILGYLTMVTSSDGSPKYEYYTGQLENLSEDSPDPELLNFITTYALPEICALAPGIVCQDWQLSGHTLSFKLYNAVYPELVITSLKVEGQVTCSDFTGHKYAGFGESVQIDVHDCVADGATADLTLGYKKGFGGFDHVMDGKLIVKPSSA